MISLFQDGTGFARFGAACRGDFTRTFEKVKGEGIVASRGALRGRSGGVRPHISNGVFLLGCAQLGPTPRCTSVRAQKRENLSPLQPFESLLRDGERQFRIPSGKLG